MHAVDGCKPVRVSEILPASSSKKIVYYKAPSLPNSDELLSHKENNLNSTTTTTTTTESTETDISASAANNDSVEPSIIIIKAQLNNELRRFRLSRDANFSLLYEELGKAFGLLPSDRLTIKYKDEEDDLITMSSDNELIEAVEVSSSGVLRLNLEKQSIPQQAPVIPQPIPQYTPYQRMDKRAQPQVPMMPTYYAPPPQQPYYPPQQYPAVYPTFSLPMRSLNLQRQQIDQMKAGRKQQQQQAEQRKKWRQEKTTAAAAPSIVPTEPARKSGVKHMARFVKDVTVDDGSEFVPNTRFIKTWKFRNESNIPWPAGSELVFVGKRSDRMGSPDAVPVNVVAMPGEEVDVGICLQSPTKSGRYIGYWRLRGPDGRKFGQRVWCSIRVPSYSSSSSSSSSSDNNSSSDPPHEFFERMEALGYSKKRSKKLWKKYSESERQQFLHPPSPLLQHHPILTNSQPSPPVSQIQLPPPQQLQQPQLQQVTQTESPSLLQPPSST